MGCKWTWKLWTTLLVTSLATAVFGSSNAQQPQNAVTSTLVADTTAIAPGAPFTVAVKLDIPSGYYTYYRNPGDFGLPTKVAFAAPPGFQVGPARFPGPEIKREDLAGKVSVIYMYRHSTMILSEIRPPETLGTGEPVTITAQVSYQYCQDSGLCFPPKPATLKLSIPTVATRTGARGSADAQAIESVRRALPEPGRRSKYAKVHAVLSQDRLRPGDRATLGVVVDVEEGYKLQLHWPTPGLIATEVILDAVPGLEPFAEPVFPDSSAASKSTANSGAANGYHGRFVIRVPVTARDSLAGPTVHLTGLMRYQACTTDGTCFPPRFASFELDVPVAGKGEKISPTNSDTFGSNQNARKAGTRN
jgi:DsbC/DsbD-like thiol-disulfide interchange protein